MWISQRKHDRDIADLQRQCEVLNDKYWRLCDEHNLLMKHLGLRQAHVSEHTKIEPIRKSQESQP